MTLEEALDLIYKKQKETRLKIRTIRAQSDFVDSTDSDLDKALLNEYNLYTDYIREITPKIRDIELNNIISYIFRVEPIEDWTKARYRMYCWKKRLDIFDKYKDDTIMTTIIRTRCDKFQNEYNKERKF